MQLLQQSNEKSAEGNSLAGNEVVTAQQNQELENLRAGLKAAHSHIRELETFIDEM